LSEGDVKKLSEGDVVLLSESDATASLLFGRNIKKTTFRDYLNKLSTKYNEDAKKSSAVKALAETLKKNVSSMNDQDKAMVQTNAFKEELNAKEKAFVTMQKQQSSRFNALEKAAFERNLDVKKSSLDYHDFENKIRSEYAKAEEEYNKKYYTIKKFVKFVKFVSFEKSSIYKRNFSELSKLDTQYKEAVSNFARNWRRYEDDFNALQNADKELFNKNKQFLENQFKKTNDIKSLSWEVLDTKNYTQGSKFIGFAEKYVSQQDYAAKAYSNDLKKDEDLWRSPSKLDSGQETGEIIRGE
jgi:hypothetical protein